MDTDIKLDNPFVGLRAFEEDEDYLFFGRTAEINDLLKKFAGSRFLAVIGSSGSGKSSLVKSGLLPAIHSGFLSSGHNWRVALMRPGDKPIVNLASALAKKGILYDSEKTNEDIPYQPIIESTLRRSGNGLMQVYKQSGVYNKEKAKNNDLQTENLLIIVDQFEELFRFSSYEKENSQGESQSLNFINLLLTATKQSELPIYVLLTMRSDFLGDCSQFRGLPEAINDGQYLVPRMTRDEIKEAITGPIAIGGAQITQSLLTRLLNDVGNDIDQLPILQHAMMRTWDVWKKRNQPDDPINLDDYLKIGGMSEALSQHANVIYDELKTDEQKKFCELIFKALTDKAADVRGTRRPRSISDLNKLTEAPVETIKEIANAFRKPGRTFLMPPITTALDNSTIIDISHESLMRIWDKLIAWTEDESQRAETFKLLADAAKRETQGGSLWKGPDLAMGLHWRKKFNDNDELIKIWAAPFKKDTGLALDFLARSNKAELEEIAEKNRLIREKKELEEAEAKRIKEEEEKERLRKRKNNRIAFAVLALFLLGAIGSLVWVNSERKKALIAEDNAKKEKEKSDSLKIEADTSAARAERSKQDALILKAEADSLRIIAVDKEQSALQSAAKAEAAAKMAREAEADALAQKDIAINLSRKSAVGEYQKLIREGPEDKESIEKDTFNYKVVAYCYHLDSLKKFLNIENAVKKNNELYEKLYFPLKALRKVDLAISKSGEKAEHLQNNIVSVKDLKDNLEVTATENNCIVVRSNSAKLKTDTIYMGKEITALAYLGEEDIIFFGTVNGEIGFIKYSTDRKNQPVFNRRNDLRSKITALEFFKDHNKNYLLATGYLGQAVMFEFDNSKNIGSQFKANVKIPVIELPEYYGEIENAHFDTGKRKVVLNTSKATYDWNPFAEDLIPILQAQLDQNKLGVVKQSTLIYK